MNILTAGKSGIAALPIALAFALLTACGGAGEDDGSGPGTPTAVAESLPTVSLTSSAQALESGESATLSWSTADATSCAASGAWSGAKALSGAQNVAPSSTATYTLTCTNSGGSTVRSTQITVSAVAAPAAPTATLSASRTSVQPGQSSTLTWNSTNAVSCAATGGWTGTKGTSGSDTVQPGSTTTYSLTCTGAGGSVTREAQIAVTSGDAATIYVSPSGSDSGPGSEAQPYRTLQKAANEVGPGDIVSVSSGTYVGFELRTSGTASSRIVFRADGTVNVTQANSGYGIYINNASYVTIQGFRVSGTSLKGIAARGATATSPMRGVHILGNAVSNTVQEGMYLSQLNGSLIEGNTISNVGTSGVTTTGHGLYLANAGSDDTVVRANIFSAPDNDWGEALHINGDVNVGGDGIIEGLIIENNRFLGGFNNGISLDGVQRSTIRNNIIIDTNHHGIRGYQIDGGGGPSALVIVNNTIDVPGNAVKTTDDDGSSIAFNNILVGDEGATSFGMSATTAANITSFAATRPDFLPTTAAIGNGITSLDLATAPTKDANGKARHSPPDIGAVEH